MRCAYLAQDRVDISEAIKCLARAMSKPRAGHMTQLIRAARYLEGMPRKSIAVPCARSKQRALRSARGRRLDTARRSTSGVVVRRGRQLLRHSSTVQNVIGLSSAESEYYALTKGGCSGLGLQSLFADWNLKLQLTLIAHRLFKREGSCIVKRSWQEHSSHTDKDAVATGNA